MKKNYTFISWIILAFLFIVGIFFDNNITYFFNNNQNKFINSFMTLISSYYFLIPVFVFIFVLLSFKNKKNIIKVPLSVVLTIIFSYILKIIVGRERPFSFEFNSFPSFHSAFVFSVFPFFKEKAKTIWFIFSIFVAFSRIYLGEHFLTDVVAGIVVGYIIGLFTNKFIERKLR